MTDTFEHGRLILRAYLDLLPAEQREVVMRLHGFEPHPPQTEIEAARAMGITLTAVKRHYTRAKRAMRESEFIAQAKDMLAEQPRLKGEDRAIERLDRTRVA